MFGPLDTDIFQRRVINTSLHQISTFGYSKGEMKGAAAVLLSCLMSLASVDATSLAKVNASKYNYKWEPVEFKRFPNDQQSDFLKSSPFFNPFPSNKQLENIVNTPAQPVKQSTQYTTRGTSTDELNLPSDGELASSYLHDIPSQKLMPPKNSMDDLLRTSSRNDPYITLKMKLKIKFPQTYRLGETIVTEPKYVTVIDKELHPFQRSDEYPEKTLTESTDPFIQDKSLGRINHAKNLPGTKTDDSRNKLEKLRYSSRIPGGVTETFTKPENVKNSQPVPVDDGFTPKTAEIDNYLNNLYKIQKLIDTMNKVQENFLKANQHYPLIDSRGTVSQFSEYMPGIQTEKAEPRGLENDPSKQDPHAILYDQIHRMSKIPPLPFENAQVLSQISKDNSSEGQVKLSDSDDSESGLAKEDPHAKLYDEIHRASKTPQVSPSGHPSISQSSKDRMPGDQVKPSDSDDSESKLGKEDPHAKLYDEIHRASKIQQISPSGYPHISQSSKYRMPGDQVKPSDSDDSESKLGKEDPHAKLYDEVHGASKIQEINPSGHPSISQSSKYRMSGDQVKPSDSDDSESKLAKEDPHAKLYDEIHRAPKIQQISPSGHPLFSQSPEGRMSEGQVKQFDSENVDNQPEKGNLPVKLFRKIRKISQIPLMALAQMFSQLSKKDSENQEVKLSDGLESGSTTEDVLGSTTISPHEEIPEQAVTVREVLPHPPSHSLEGDKKWAGFLSPDGWKSERSYRI